MSATALDTITTVAGTEFRHMQVRRQVAENQYGQTLTANVWNTRTLDTVTTNAIPGASLSSNQITLPAGTYQIRAISQCYRVNTNVIRWRQVSGTAADVVLGMNTYANTSTDGGAADLEGRFTITAQQTFELQHYVQAAPSPTESGGVRLNGTVGPAGVDGVFVLIDIYQEVDATNIKAIETGKLFHAQEKLNSDGTTNVADSWTTRALPDLILNELDGVSFSSNQVTLPDGTYYVMASAVFRNSDQSKIRFRNVTDNITEALGHTVMTSSGGGDSMASAITGLKFTVSGGPKVFELQYYANTVGTLGTGLSLDGELELYADLKIWKVGN